MDLRSRLIIGLGNPGREYDGTRHNMGFEVLDSYARACGVTIGRSDTKALTGEAMRGNTRVYLLKPMTFMNLSGQAAAAFVRNKPITANDILVVVDDIALPTGKLRMRAGGSAGGHNGLKSLIQSLGTDQFPRLRIGVGAPKDPSQQVDFVLGRFNRQEANAVADAIEDSIAAIDNWIDLGTEAAMNRTNTILGKMAL